MKLFTRCLFLLSVLALPWASALAATITVTIGNNFYSPMAVTARPGDVIRFVWQAGVHPTQSDSATPLWAVFTLGAANTSFTTAALTTPGTYPYHCQAHSSFDAASNQYVGQTGTITVAPATPTAALDARAAGALSVYPNPSRGQVTVQLTQKAGQSCQLRLNNIIGQEVRTVALRPELTAAGLPLDLSDLRAGVYFYSLLVDGRVTSTKRLVLQN